jgi:hypothetical protein
MLAFGAFVGLFISSNASVDPCYAQVRGLLNRAKSPGIDRVLYKREVGADG